MEIQQRDGNGHRYELKLALPDRSLILIRRQTGLEECLFVPFVDVEGIPAHEGRTPSMRDLEHLADLHIRLEAATSSSQEVPGLSTGELSRARRLKPLRLLREDT
jgi:hypothetical protein